MVYYLDKHIMHSFKQFLLEASKLSDEDKVNIRSLLNKCYVKNRPDINAWLDDNVYQFITTRSSHSNSTFFTKTHFINDKGKNDTKDTFNDKDNQLENKIKELTNYLNTTYTIEIAAKRFNINFKRLTFEDASNQYEKDEMENIDYKVIKTYSDGYKMVSLLTQKSLNKEGKELAHCTKDEKWGYLKQIKKGEIELISLRDSKNKPHATIQHGIKNHVILQIKGNGNGPVVSKYIPYIMTYLNDNKFGSINDLQNINAFKIDNTVYDIDNIPSDLVIKNGIYIVLTKLTKVPQLPQKISGDFDCSTNKDLISLVGSPQIINGSFYCFNNIQLPSLEGGPQIIKKHFSCKENLGLTLLKGCPTKIGLDFICYNNLNLTTLEGLTIQHIHGNFDCRKNDLTTLKHCPQRIDGNFDCSDNSKLVSLEGIPEFIKGNFHCKNVGKKFTEEEIRKVSNIKGKVYV